MAVSGQSRVCVPVFVRLPRNRGLICGIANGKKAGVVKK